MQRTVNIQRGFRVHKDWDTVLDNIRIVLVGITHAGNIGAIARVMKNMALKNLILVSSTECGPETEAPALASGAYDVVERAKFVQELPEALADVTMAVGTSARLGGKRVTAGAPSEIVPLLLEQAREGPVACVFGRESRGLTNEELKLCTHHLIIPTDERFASMNVAHATAVVCSDIYARACRPSGFQVKRFKPASTADREAMYDHIEKVLVRAGFLDETNPLRMMRDLRRILNRADMDQRDVKIVRGIFRKMANMVRIADERVRDLATRLGDCPDRDDSSAADENTEC